MKERIVRLLLHISGPVVLVLLSSGPVLAAIPLITDDTGTQGKGKTQLELFGEYGHAEEEAFTDGRGELSATLTYGIADPVDIALTIPYHAWHVENSESEAKGSGFSDLAMEAKWRFYDKEGVSLAVKPGLTVPTGDKDKDLGNGKMTYYIFFIASEDIKPWAFHLNLAYIRNNNSENDRNALWHASLATTVDMAKNLKLVGNVGVETNPQRSSNTPPVYLLAGAIYSLAGNFDIGLGLKAGLTRPETDIAVRGGVTYRF